VLLSNPNDVTVLDALAISEFVTGDRASAERHWRGVLTRDSRNETALQSLAMLTRQTGNLTEAGERLAQLVQINPWSANYQAQYAQVCDTQGHTEAAIKAALRGVELDPSRSFAHDWLASALARKGDQPRSLHHRRIAQRLRIIESQSPPGATLRR
jgi:predicted Zn-dependent protease